MIVTSHRLVPGDIIFLKEGDCVPADARLFQVTTLEADESILTGESVPVKKITHPLQQPPEQDISAADKKNLVFMNSVIAKGKGMAIVFATGNQTEMGKIASAIVHGKKAKTPLQEV